MAKIVTITTSFDKEMHTYQSETEDEVLDLIKWIYTNNTDIRDIGIYMPWEFDGQKEVIEITKYGYDIRYRIFPRIEKWLATKEAKKIIISQKPKLKEIINWTKIPETQPRRKPGRRKVNE